MKIHYIDIGINLTNKQFQNDVESIIQNAVDAEVFKMILTGTSESSGANYIECQIIFWIIINSTLLPFHFPLH